MASGLRDYYRILPETTPEDLPKKSTEQLEQYYRHFAELRSELSDRNLVDVCMYRMDLIRSEIQMRRMEAHSQRLHQEVIGVGKKTLTGTEKTVFWARWAVGVGIVGVIATVVVGILQIWHANTDTSKTSQASPQTFQQTPTPIVLSPEPEANSSSATPSPQQAATEAQSSDTPSP